MERLKTPKVSFFCDLSVFTLFLVSFIMMLTHHEGTTVLAKLVSNLRFFTVQSNIVCGVAYLIEAISLFPVINGRKKNVPENVLILKLIGTVGVAVTFLVVLAFLGPLFGHRSMYIGTNFFMHLTTPVCAVISFCISDSGRHINKKHAWLGSLHLAVYALCYMINIILNGIEGNDFYALTIFGANWYVPELVIITGIGIVLSLFFRKISIGKGYNDGAY